MSIHFGLTDNELAFLAEHLGPRDRVFEYGTGETTTGFFAARCKQVTAVEHQPGYAERAIHALCKFRNVSIIYAPPDFPYAEGTEDDGDLATFRTYVESYVGRGIDVVLIDGRARVECARWVAERAPFGPNPSVRVFVHDVDRPALAPIYTDTVVDGLLVPRAFDEVKQVERLMLMKMRET